MVGLEGEIAARRSSAAPAEGSSSLLTTDDAGVVLSPTIESARLAPAQIRSIEPYGSVDRARIVISLTGPSTFDVGQLTPDPLESDGGKPDRATALSGSGPRLFVDLARAKPGKIRQVEVGGLVERVRIAPRGEGSRVVLDLAGVAYRRVFYLPEPFRVIIDVASHLPQVAGPIAGSQRRIGRVALDPGHGGNDSGAVGPSGLREKDVTLDIAHRVAPVLARELGILTLLTRDGDRYVGLDERTARANAFHADLFVSIHCNAAENPSARGVMSFVLDTTRDEIAGKIAARENATSPEASADVASIVSHLRLSDLGARSTRLAELLQRTTVSSLAGAFADTPDQGVKTAGFFVLVGAEMPGVLYETSFISNPTEEMRLGRAEYRQRLADALVNAIRAFREGR
jgi:N-acetylmuramoyl-L-alanine amidase